MNSDRNGRVYFKPSLVVSIPGLITRDDETPTDALRRSFPERMAELIMTYGANVGILPIGGDDYAICWTRKLVTSYTITLDELEGRK